MLKVAHSVRALTSASIFHGHKNDAKEKKSILRVLQAHLRGIMVEGTLDITLDRIHHCSAAAAAAAAGAAAAACCHRHIVYTSGMFTLRCYSKQSR